MTDIDRKKWDLRYRNGAFSDRQYPSVFLAQQFPHLGLVQPTPRVLDVACGSGRNSHYLAQQGCQVIGVDISSEALTQARQRSQQLGLDIRWECTDLLDCTQPVAIPVGLFDVVIMFRFVALGLLDQLVGQLVPGGYFLLEQHLAWPSAVAGPSSKKYRVVAGSVAQALVDLDMEIVQQFEGLVTEPDGEISALCRIVARASAERSS